MVGTKGGLFGGMKAGRCCCCGIRCVEKAPAVAGAAGISASSFGSKSTETSERRESSSTGTRTVPWAGESLEIGRVTTGDTASVSMAAGCTVPAGVMDSAKGAWTSEPEGPPGGGASTFGINGVAGARGRGSAGWGLMTGTVPPGKTVLADSGGGAGFSGVSVLIS